MRSVIVLLRYSVIASLCYSVIAFGIIILSGYAFAEEVQLEGIIARIPAARILDWSGDAPTVDKGAGPQLGWEEQALAMNDKVCCQGACDYVDIALTRSGDNVVRLSDGCITINTIEAGSVSYTTQDSGESLFGLEVLSEGSTFTVETPDAIIGVSGTIFGAKVDKMNNRTLVGLLEGTAGHSLKVTDKVKEGYSDPDDGKEQTLTDNQQFTVNSEGLNSLEDLTESDEYCGLSLGKWKQKVGKIAKKAKGKKKGIYKHIEGEEGGVNYLK